MLDPVTAAAETVTFPLAAETSIPMPLAPVPVTAPDAEIVTLPAPATWVLIPVLDPVTAAAETVTFPLSAKVSMAEPVLPVTVPLTFIEIAPPPVLLATMPLLPPMTALPLADWVNVIPAVPDCVRLNPSFCPTSTGVSEFSVTLSAVAPVALRL